VEIVGAALLGYLLLFLLPLIGPALGGLPVGVCQWLVLRRHVRADGAPEAVPAVNLVTGKLVSAMAGYLVASRIGATLLGGAAAGAITGVTLAFALGGLPDADPV